MMYLLMFVIFLLVMQFAFAFLPYLLPVMLIFWLISMFRKPNVKVYTNTYTFDSQAQNSNYSRSSSNTMRDLPTRKPLEDSIDAEYTEVHEYDIGK